MLFAIFAFMHSMHDLFQLPYPFNLSGVVQLFVQGNADRRDSSIFDTEFQV